MKKVSVALISESVGKTPEVIASSFVFDEAYRLAKKGINVHIIRSKIEEDSYSYGIYFHGEKTKVDSQAIELIMRNLLLYPIVSLFRKPTSIYGENRYALNVSRVIEKNDIDLIHAHFAYPEGLVGLLLKRLINKPLIVTTYGYDIQIEQSINYGIRLKRRYRALVDKVVKKADIIIANSSYNYELLKKMGCPIDKIRFIHLGVDITRFNTHYDKYLIKRILGIDLEAPVIFSCKSGVARYGIEYLLRSALYVLDKEPKTIFVINGKGPLHEYYISLCRELRIEKNVIFTREIPRDNIPYFYASCDVYVNPALIEGFGLVTAEAMACGKPVIGTNLGGTTDLIEDGVTGFLIEPKNPMQIAERIITLIRNPDLSKDMGIKGRNIIEVKFDKDKKIEELIKNYNDVYAKSDN